MTETFNVMAVVQGGRLQYEALLFMASLQATEPNRRFRVFLAEPQPAPRWRDDPRITDDDLRARLVELGAEIVPFENIVFGQDYPHGNKIMALTALPKGEPFVFFDTDTLFLKPLSQVPFDFERPAASMRREDTWPTIELYGPGYTEIWKSLYERFKLDFESSLDLSQPDEYWERYLYFNAGWFFGRCPHDFADLFCHYAAEIARDPGKALEGQALYPWLDQIALPLVIHALGGERPGPELAGLDGDVTCHWRTMPLLYARESDAVVEALERAAYVQKTKKFLRDYPAFKAMIYGGRGRKVRALYDRDNLPRRERAIRRELKKAGLWMR
jgi:hypothetical protein